MNKKLKIITLSTLVAIFSGCVPAPRPQISLGEIVGGVKKEPIATQPVVDKEYGAKPINYTNSIRAYFSTKIARGNLSIYKYGKPKRAYKRKGFAYGGDIAWKGWLVETSIATPTRTGRLLTPKPYMVLFSGEQIVEHILGYSHKLLVKVDK
ncbi:MAG: hypothetical protein DSZ07_02470 [Sulfurovum sp.]|nr:MAG: hypothetical protein DSZ07_02470 [Sulfurovum sp.]